MNDKRFLGSTIALIIGGFAIIGGLANPSSVLFAGIYIVLSALAYRSLKKRKLGLLGESKMRSILEIVAIVVVLLLILLQNDLFRNIVNDPFPNVVIPLWAIIAYLILYFKPHKKIIEFTHKNSPN